MQSKHFAVLLVLTAVGMVVFLMLDGGPESEDIESIARRQMQRQQQVKPDTDKPFDFESVAREGKAQPIPDDLIVEPDPNGFWFVGKLDHDVGVEIPFAPGKIPTTPPTEQPVRENPGFVGADACQQCHQEKYESFIHTAHYRTSRPANAETIVGSFESGRNEMETFHPNVNFKMIQRDGDCFQRVSFFDWNFEVPFHIVTGSSKMAQTFLYWHGDALYQMNVTYLNEIDDWINSPGFIDGDAAYARPIGARCLECHSTYADYREPPNHFTPGTLIYGVSCERCHGPGRDHVDYHAANPEEKKASQITVPTDLPREQQLAICSQCHSGISDLKDQPYQFRPGDLVADHYESSEQQSGNSVHTSNQLLRLSRSECFMQSQMTCADCHNPHQNERGNGALFSERCMKCHDNDECGMSERLGERLSENCIECHMPIRASENLRLDTAEGSVFPPLRDHYVRVDKLAAKSYLKKLDADDSREDGPADR